MTTAENSLVEQPAQESPGLISKVTKSVGDAFDSLKGKAPSTDQVKSSLSDTSTKVSGVYGQAKGKIGLKDYQKMTGMFKAWLPELGEGGLARKLRTETKAVTGWLTELPDDELGTFVRGLQSAGSTFNFDLEWLIDPEISKTMDDELKRPMVELVQLYGVAAWKASQMEEGIKRFKNLQAWLADPFAKQYEEFNKQLFAKVVGAGLTEAPPLDLFLAPEEEREAFSVQAIKDLIAAENERFYQILKSQVEIAEVEAAEGSDLSESGKDGDGTESEPEGKS